MDLTSDNVEKLFVNCMSSKGVDVDGVMASYSLDVSGQEDNIASMLKQLPDEFQNDGGGGWSFLNACMAKNGEQWTGMHSTMDKLFMLGIAAGKAKWLLPRDMWSALPGGMPYVVVE